MHMPSIDWLCIMITERLSTRESVVYAMKYLFLISVVFGLLTWEVVIEACCHNNKRLLY